MIHNAIDTLCALINIIIMLIGSSVKTSFDYELALHVTSIGVCINCTFLNGININSCVAVVHQRISQLSSGGLMNIESSHKFNRSGDTAYGCIEGVNLTDHQIGVIGSHRSIKKTTQSKDADKFIILAHSLCTCTLL